MDLLFPKRANARLPHTLLKQTEVSSVSEDRFYKVCDEWVKFWDNINELYRASSRYNTVCIA